MTQYFTDFSEYTADTTPAGWRKRGATASTSTIVADGGATGGKLLRFQTESDASSVRGLSWDAVDADKDRDDVEVVMRFRYASGINTTSAYVFARGLGTTTYNTNSWYGATTGISSGNRVLTKRVTGSSTTLDTQTGTAIDDGRWAWMRLRCSGTSISAKHWLDSEPEPETWGVTVTDSSISSTGWVGVGVGITSGVSAIDVDIFGVGTNGDAAPTSAGATSVSFSGTIPTQNATEGTPFSVDLSGYFSGTETPFVYSVQSGTLPTGLTLNSSTGVISGTPTTAGTTSGIVIRATDGNLDTADSNSFSIDVAAADTTAPTLTSPTGTATGQTTASGTVDTDEANGTLYYLATTNSTESAATVKGGSSQAVTTTGEQSVGVTGLTAATGYYLHYVQRDAAGNDSTVASSALFTTDAAPVVVKGVRIQLHDGTTEQASLTGLTVAWFDDDDPATFGAPVLQSATETTDASGWLEVDLDGYTALGVGDPGFLIVYKAGATATDDIVFAGRLVVEDIG